MYRIFWLLAALVIFSRSFMAFAANPVATVPGMVVRQQNEGALLRFPATPPVRISQVILVNTLKGWQEAQITNIRGTSMLIKFKNPSIKLPPGRQVMVRYTIAEQTLQNIPSENASEESENSSEAQTKKSSTKGDYIFLVSAGGGIGLMPQRKDAGQNFQLSLKPALSISPNFSIGISVHQGTFFRENKKFLITRFSPEIRFPFLRGDSWELFPYAGIPVYTNARPQQGIGTRNQADTDPGGLKNSIPYGGIGGLWKLTSRFGFRVDAGMDQVALMASMIL